MRAPLPPPIPVEEAQRRLSAQVPPPETFVIPFGDALGAVLAEEVNADADFPPFHRAMMDGYALIAADTTDGPVVLEIVEEIPAGRVPRRRIERGRCARIMTGAPLPEGADAVQQVEKTEPLDGRVRVLAPVSAGQNVAPRGSDMLRGARVLHIGQPIRPQEIAVLAAVGKTSVRIYRRPRCAMVVTGDELVDPSETPGPGRVRNTNGFSVAAQIRQIGLECDVIGRAPDRLEEIRGRVREGLERDVLVLSGGVSAGAWDLVIPALEAEGVRSVLHQVLLRPGRPFFFGTRGRKVAFGLPGNPVSSFVTFEVFVRPFLRRMMGHPAPERPRRTARLLEPLPKKADRVQMLPARVEGTGEHLVARPLPWQGSADIFALARANALAIQPRETPLEAGAGVEVVLLE